MGSLHPTHAAARDLMAEAARLAARAEAVFASRFALRDWIVCVLQRRLEAAEGPRERCGEVAAAACAIGFGGECPLASTPREFAEIVLRLPTAQLEALLRLEEEHAKAPAR